MYKVPDIRKSYSSKDKNSGNDASVIMALMAIAQAIQDNASDMVAFYATTTQSITSSAAYSDLTTYTEVLDSGSNFVHTTGIFTAPENGLYYFSANAAYVDPTAATSRFGIAIFVSSTAITGQSTHQPLTNHDPMINCSTIYPLTAGQTVKASVYQDSGGSEAMVSPAHFCGALIKRF